MARRRFQRSKHSPDRGWVVGTFTTSTGAIVPNSNINGSVTLFDFADIDAEALTGRIEQDKSDWFVKRVLLDIYAAVSFDETEPTDVARIYEIGMGIMGNADVEEFGEQNMRVITPEVFNYWARTFRTYTRPVYAGGLIGYTGDFNIATENVTTGGPVGGFSTTAPFWGPSSISDDFDVSNAGLRNNQSCVILFSVGQGPASFNWQEGDNLYVAGTYRILLQKRRT